MIFSETSSTGGSAPSRQSPHMPACLPGRPATSHLPDSPSLGKRQCPGRPLRPETKGQAEPARTGRGPSSVRCRDQSGGEERRAISVPLDRVTSGQSVAVEDNEVGWSTEVTGDDLSNSQ